VLLVVSFFAKVSGGPRWAAMILALVVIQVLLGVFGHAAPLLAPPARHQRADPALGGLHGWTSREFR
jgi:hypothetical protein